MKTFKDMVWDYFSDCENFDYILELMLLCKKQMEERHWKFAALTEKEQFDQCMTIATISAKESKRTLELLRGGKRSRKPVLKLQENDKGQKLLAPPSEKE